MASIVDQPGNTDTMRLTVMMTLMTITRGTGRMSHHER